MPDGRSSAGTGAVKDLQIKRKVKIKQRVGVSCIKI